MLHDFVVVHRQAIVRRCRARVATRTPLTSAGEWIDHGVPAFLDELEGALRARPTRASDLEDTAAAQRQDLIRQGFSIAEVVHRYGDVGQAITGLAADSGTAIGADEFRVLSLCLDDAIAGAVTEFGRQQNQSTLNEERARANERAGFLAHEMRNLLETALMAFEVLKAGAVPIGGSTGGVLQRSLTGARVLTNRALADVKLAHGAQNRQRFAASGFVDELLPAATLEGNARGIQLRAIPGDDEALIEADPHVLSAVVMNLLQNAFKFTRPGTTVVLRVRSTIERVMLEIEDECGGLPDGDVDALFRPFEQRGADRSGLGLGLAFSRSAVEAMAGRIYVRDLPAKGCVFIVDLPRIMVAAVAMV